MLKSLNKDNLMAHNELINSKCPVNPFTKLLSKVMTLIVVYKKCAVKMSFHYIGKWIDLQFFCLFFNTGTNLKLNVGMSHDFFSLK